MTGYLLPIAYVVLLWWFSTGVLLKLNDRASRGHEGRVWAVLAVIGVASIGGLWAVRDEVTATGAALGFLCGLVVWGCLEFSYYAGLLTGPQRGPCPDDCHGWQRFGLAISTSLYHELAVIGFAGVLWLVTTGAANQVGLHAYVVLWLMRWSAKLNLFLGVRNVNLDWLPPNLAYLSTYMRLHSFNPLFPFSVGFAAVALVVMSRSAIISLNSYQLWSSTLVAALIALALIEHLFLMLPFGESRLWGRSTQRGVT